MLISKAGVAYPCIVRSASLSLVEVKSKVKGQTTSVGQDFTRKNEYHNRYNTNCYSIRNFTEIYYALSLLRTGRIILSASSQELIFERVKVINFFHLDHFDRGRRSEYSDYGWLDVPPPWCMYATLKNMLAFLTFFLWLMHWQQ